MPDEAPYCCWASSQVFLELPALCRFLSSFQPGCSSMEWKLPRHRSQQSPWSVSSRAGIHLCPGREGTGPVLARSANSSLFLHWLNVCFQIPEAFVTPHPYPRWGPGLPLLPSSPCLTRLVCRAGHQAKPLSPAAHQLGPEP